MVNFLLLLLGSHSSRERGEVEGTGSPRPQGRTSSLFDAIDARVEREGREVE